MKHFLYFITVISIAVVQFASAHTFPECPKQDEEIRFKKNSILYLKSFLNDPDFSFVDFAAHNVGLDRNKNWENPDVYFYLMPNTLADNKKLDLCIATFFNGKNIENTGIFKYSEDQIEYFIPGYNEDGILLSYRGEFNNGKKNGYWEYYYKDGEFQSFGFYKDGKREGIWFEFPIRWWHNPSYWDPAIISYKDGKKHGPFVNSFGRANYSTDFYKDIDFTPAISETVDYGSFYNDKKDGVWELKCRPWYSGTCQCAPDWINKKTYDKGILSGHQNFDGASGYMENGLKEGVWIYEMYLSWCSVREDLIKTAKTHLFEMMGQYQGGIKNGYWRIVHSNGRNRAVGDYKNGKKEGLWIYSHRNGKIASEVIYEEGSPEDGYWSIYELESYNEGLIKNGKKEGKWLVNKFFSILEDISGNFWGGRVGSGKLYGQIWENGILISEKELSFDKAYSFTNSNKTIEYFKNYGGFVP